MRFQAVRFLRRRLEFFNGRAAREKRAEDAETSLCPLGEETNFDRRSFPRLNQERSRPFAAKLSADKVFAES